MSSLVEVKIAEQIGYLTMNRPDKLNALSKELVAEMNQALDMLAANDEVKVIILAGNGKSFCAGGDIDSMKSMNTPAAANDWIEYVSGLSKKILTLDKYVIAAVHGYAAGAGFSLALAADFIVAEKDAKFALSFTNIGLIPDLGLIKLLTERVSPPVAKEWISSGKVLTAEEVRVAKIINRVVDGPAVEGATEFAQFIVNGPSISNKFVKYLVNYVGELHKETAFQQENLIQTLLLQTEDHQEGVNAFFEKRRAVFKGI